MMHPDDILSEKLHKTTTWNTTLPVHEDKSQGVLDKHEPITAQQAYASFQKAVQTANPFVQICFTPCPYNLLTTHEKEIFIEMTHNLNKLQEER